MNPIPTAKTHTLNNLLEQPLFDPAQHSLNSFLDQHGEQYAYAPVNYEQKGIQYRDCGTVLIEGKSHRLNLIQHTHLLGYVKIDDTPYLVCATYNDPHILLRFYRLEHNSFSYRNYFFGGGVMGVYHFETKYPHLIPLFDSLSGRQHQAA